MAIAVDQKSIAISNTIPKMMTASNILSGRLKFCAMIHGEATKPSVKKPSNAA
ncbi:MAG TPA: hypothetical protein VGO56_04235 [Pyrinomonadaceae bacterium]|nr:hypothetical protein [Pyrinomonadaceae bacterium]